jgi:hypothetical protein
MKNQIREVDILTHYGYDQFIALINHAAMGYAGVSCYSRGSPLNTCCERDDCKWHHIIRNLF